MATATATIVPKVGQAYRIYGRMGDMKRMSPIGGGSFVVNLIYAELFTPKDAIEVGKLMNMLNELKDQGEFEIRKVKGWSV